MAGPIIEHVCWAYDDPAQFVRYAAGFLTAGAAAGEDVWFVAAEAATPDVAGVRFVDLRTAYPAGHIVDPAAQVDAYARATAAAVAAGYTGLRVVADATSLVGTPAQLDAFARYEFAVGRLMHEAPLRAVCGYDRSVLGDATVAELACLHPAGIPDTAGFRLHPAAGPDEVVLSGELDTATEELFAAALRRAGPGGAVVVHADDLRFIDHRSLLTLERYAERQAATIVLRTRRTGARHVADLLELARVRVEVVA